ncbi:MAG: hypothetical protein ACREVD_04805 [Burkholderiales bacterium]
MNMLVAVAQTVAALGVVISVFYVGRQVKITNAMTRSSVRMEVSAEVNAWAMAAASSVELSTLMAKVHYEGFLRDQATGPEKIRIAYAYIAFLGAINIAHQHLEDGIISKEQIEELFPQENPVLKAAYLKSLWPYMRGGYRPSFSRWLESRYGLTGG